MQLLREKKEEKKKKKDYPQTLDDFLPKSPLISAENGKEDEVWCVLCVVRERVAKIMRERECVSAEMSKEEREKGWEKNI